MIKKTNILWTMTTAVLTLFSACTSDDGVLQEDERVPIMISTAISPTRSTTTQDTQIAEDQLVYLWGFKQSGSGAAEFSNSYFTDYFTDYWLTKVKSDGSLIGNSFTEKYYYPDEALTMVGIHGNFTAVDGSVSNAYTHNVYADQSTLSNYAQSDLLHWSAYDLSSSPTAISAQFNHKLCKIVVVLESDIYTAADLNKALVTFNGVKPTITMTPQTGALGTVSGTATTITPYKSDNIHREAIIPPQDKPAEFITVTMNGYTTTATPDKPTTAFAPNTKYIYTITVNKTGITLKTSIEAWNNASGNNSSLTPGMPTRNVKMNPLWYVAEYNMTNTHTSTTLTMGTVDNSGYFYSWSDAMKLFSTSSNGTTSISNYYNGFKWIVGKNGTWHLPTQNEWNSIVPGSKSDGTPRVNLVTIASAVGSGATYSGDCNLSFGYNDETKGAGGTFLKENSYWYRKSENLIYAIRYCNTDYCSAWKYEWKFNGVSQYSPGTLTISSTLIDKISVSEAQSLYGTTDSNWESIYFGNSEYKGAVQRTFAALGGNEAGSNSAANMSQGEFCQYWSTTENSSNNTEAWNMGADGSTFSGANSHAYLYPIVKTNGRSVRLFRDNPEQDVWKNPLWYVAEYNMTNGVNASTLTMASADDAGYYYTWKDAMSTFGLSATGYDGYKKGNKVISDISGKTWHLPTRKEFRSIIPEPNLWADALYDANYDYYFANVQTVVFGCNYETKTLGVDEKSYWHKISDKELHAIRFIGTPYCSAWKYVLENNRLIISATLIDPFADDNSGFAAKIWYNHYWATITWGNDITKGAVQRSFFERGWRKAETNTSGSSYEISYKQYGWYWAATKADNDDGRAWGIYHGGTSAAMSHTTATYAFPVRLFLDN